MPKIVKSTVLGIGLLAGVAIGAYAQTDNVAALPPGSQAPTPSAAPSPRRRRRSARPPANWVEPGETDPAGGRRRSLRRPEAGRTVVPQENRPRPWPRLRMYRRPASELIGVFLLKRTGRPSQAPACLVFGRRFAARHHLALRSGTCGGTGTASCRRARRISRRDPLAVGRLETTAFGFVERREQRREPGPLGPFLDRVGAVQHLQIFGLPDVERGRGSASRS